MACKASDVVNLAVEEIGYYEKASNAFLDSKTANAGYANYTKYGRYCGCNPGAWCMMFLSWLFAMICGKTAAKTMLFGMWPHYNCGTVTDMAASQGRRYWSWYGLNKVGKSGLAYAPKYGDLIVFTNAWKTRDHIGIVTGCSGGYVYTIEGNSGNMCRRRSYSVKDPYIMCYLTPAYAAEPVAAAGNEYIARFQKYLGMTSCDGVYGPKTRANAIKALQNYYNKEDRYQQTVDGVIGPNTYWSAALRSAQYGDTGAGVYWLQGMLYCLGYNPKGFDGEWGSGTQKALDEFHKACGIESTLCDCRTIAAMFDYAPPAHKVLRKGDTGSEVQYLQKKLWAYGFYFDAIAGKYDGETADDVKDYQKMNSLTVDGVCSLEMWKHLEG